MNIQSISNDLASSSVGFHKKSVLTTTNEGFVAPSAAGQKDAEGPSTPPPSGENLEVAISQIAKFVSQQTQSEISFSIDEESGLNIVKVIDSKTKDVIRQIPSEEVIAIAQALDKLQGLFVRDKV